MPAGVCICKKSWVRNCHADFGRISGDFLIVYAHTCHMVVLSMMFDRKQIVNILNTEPTRVFDFRQREYLDGFAEP